MRITYPFIEFKGMNMVEAINSGTYNRDILKINKIGFIFNGVDHPNCMMNSYFTDVIIDIDTGSHYTIDFIGLSNIYVYSL